MSYHETDTSYALAESYVLQWIEGAGKDENTIEVDDMGGCDCVPTSVRAADGALWRLERVEYCPRSFWGGVLRGLVATYHTED